MTKQHFSIGLLIGFFSCLPWLLHAQDGIQLSLKDALDHAMRHNHDVRNALTDVRIARKRVSETTATGLPQISAGVSYLNYPDIPTQLLPDFLSPAVYGVLLDEGLVQEMPVGTSARLFEAQFGTQHNATAKAELSQLIFSGSYLVGLQAAQAYVDFSKTRLRKTHTEVKASVSNAYYQVLVSARSRDILDSTLVSLRKMHADIQAVFQQGLIDETDVDQVELLLTDLEASYSQAENQYTLSLHMLKYQLGLGLEQTIVLTDNLESLIEGVRSDLLLAQAFSPEQHVDFAIIRNQEMLSGLNVKLQKAAYLPTVSGFYSYQQVAQRQDFDFFNPDGKWFPTQVIGAQMDIPIFSSGYRKYRLQQAKLELEKSRVLTDQVGTGLQLGAESARDNLQNAALVYQAKEKAMRLAAKVYERSRIRFSGGMASSMEFQQAHNQFLRAEGDVILATFELLNAKTAYEKAYSIID